MNNASCDIFYDRGYVHIHKRWFSNLILIFVIFQTPLHLAADNKDGDIVEILLRNGANIHEKDVIITEMRSGGGDGKTERQSEQL